MSEFKVLDWKPIAKGSLRGFCKIEMPSGMILNDVSVFFGEHGLWASPPSKPTIGRDGPLLNSNGKPRYSAMVEFTSKDLREKWSGAVIAALVREHPEIEN